MHCLGGRIIKPEILDTVSPDEARPSLADLVRINHHFGGHSLLRSMLSELVQPEERFTLLDVGAASGDMAASVLRSYPRASVTSADYLESHLAAAAPPRVAADAFRLPFRDAGFDFVFSSLFLHHFPDDQVVALLTGFRKVARRAVLMIDLERHPVPYYFLPATRWLFGWHPITLNDAPISVEAGFRKAELENLARAAGFAQPRVRVHRPAFRLSLLALL